jgi:hypothetical protein
MAEVRGECVRVDSLPASVVVAVKWCYGWCDVCAQMFNYIASVGSSAACTCVSDSSLWASFGMAVWYCGILTISVMVSVTAQKYGGLSDQPIGSTSGMAMSGPAFGISDGRVTARLMAVVGDISTW